MKKVKGFTLIELLIVVAIIAILAAIAVPNFLEAQIRSKVARAVSDMRSLATALEAYMVDTNQYPMSYDNQNPAPTAGRSTINAQLLGNGLAKTRLTFATFTDGKPNSLTTPIAYITTIPPDPFADTKGAAFGYGNAGDSGWIMWSYGPDTDEATTNGDIQTYLRSGNMGTKWQNCSIYNPGLSNPTPGLLSGFGAQVTGATSYTYDATNGTTSDGDVWRHRQ
jgi:prepilin-type N-terminal cleavage/methylation domain-containing protein